MEWFKTETDMTNKIRGHLPQKRRFFRRIGRDRHRGGPKYREGHSLSSELHNTVHLGINQRFETPRGPTAQYQHYRNTS